MPTKPTASAATIAERSNRNPDQPERPACPDTPTPASSPAQFLTSEQAAPLLGVPERTVRLWCRTGRLPAVRPGRAWLIPISAVNELRSQALAGAAARREGGAA